MPPIVKVYILMGKIPTKFLNCLHMILIGRVHQCNGKDIARNKKVKIKKS